MWWLTATDSRSLVTLWRRWQVDDGWARGETMVSFDKERERQSQRRDEYDMTQLTRLNKRSHYTIYNNTWRHVGMVRVLLFLWYGYRTFENRVETNVLASEALGIFSYLSCITQWLNMFEKAIWYGWDVWRRRGWWWEWCLLTIVLRLIVY